MILASDSLAADIVSQHEHRAIFGPLPAEHLGDLDFAYAVQDRVLSLWAERFGDVAGWKVGLTTPRMQQMCGVAQPIAGAILRSRLHASPAIVSAGDYVRLGIETELAFRVAASPLPDEQLTAASVRGYLDLACASFELIEDRGADYGRLDAGSMIADNSWNGGVVLSEPAPVTGVADFSDIGGVLEINDAQVDSGTTRDVGGDPLAIVAWLANHLAGRGRRLEPGQWIMTGSVVPTRFARAGDRYRFTLEGFAPALLEVG